MKKEVAMIAVAVVCVGVIAVAGVFLPSQTLEENKTWWSTQEIQGTNTKDIWISIESDIWRIHWYTFLWENSNNKGWLRFDVSEQIGLPPVADGWMVNGWPQGDIEYIIEGGIFVVQIQAENTDWHFYISEYR